MGRINTIIQRNVDERIEQKQAVLTERVEKLENEKGNAGLFLD